MHPWTIYREVLLSVLYISLPFNSRCLIWGDLYCHRGNRILVLNLITAVMQLIAAKWKLKESLTKTEWSIKMRHVFLLNKLSAVCKYRKGDFRAIEKFKKYWYLFMQDLSINVQKIDVCNF